MASQFLRARSGLRGSVRFGSFEVGSLVSPFLALSAFHRVMWDKPQKPSFFLKTRFLGYSNNFCLNLASIIQINTVRMCRLSKIFVVFLVALVFFGHFLDFLSYFFAKIGGCDHFRATAPLQNLTHQPFSSLGIEM